MITFTLKDKPRSRSLIIALFLLSVMLPLWWLVGNWYGERLLADRRTRITGLLAVHANLLNTAIQQRLALLNGLKAFADAHVISHVGLESAEFAAFASVLCGGMTGIRNVTVSPDGITLFVYPIEGNEGLVGQDLVNDRRAAVRTDVQRAIRSRRVVLSGPYAIRPKGLELVARQAVYKGETFWGLVSISCDISPILADVVPDPPSIGIELTIQDRTDHLLYGKKSVLEGNPVFGKIDLPDGPWKLAAVPLGGWNDAVSRSLLQFRGVTLAILVLLTAHIYLLISYSARLKLAVRQRTDDLHRSLSNRREEEESLSRTLVNLRRAMRGTLEALTLAVETKDPYTSGHQRRVADLARTIAMEMGLPDADLDGIRMAAFLHDIGKISLPAEILSKASRLSEVEFSLIKTHPQNGYDILKEIEFPWPVARMVWQHHERLDGSGYPLGISGEDILLGARILAVADVVEAMASDRSYRPMPGLEKALEEIGAQKGVLYDPAVVDACLRIFREKDFRLA
ncbi:MAG: HD domain-containing protein [Syntrophales bacterium]|nr:HD domain-containing protein [Syntrophales bacterium]